MPAGVTGTAQIDQAVERFLAESRYTLQERRGVIRSSIRVETLPENEGPSVYIPKYGTVTTYALTDGIDMAQAQQITDTLMTLTPAEYGAQVVLTDMMMMTVRDSFFEVANRILADSFDRQQDQTLCDDSSNFSVGLGSAGTTLAVGHVMAAEAAIRYNAPANGTAGRGGEPAPYPFACHITPSAAHALRKTLSLTGYSGGTPSNENRQIMGTPSGEFRIPGVDAAIKTDINFNKDTSDDAVMNFLSKEAWILAELGSAASPEKQRDASLRAWEINYVGRWARGEYADAWGRSMTFDSALPTS